MDLVLRRTIADQDGIFGQIQALNLVTLEHAYGVNSDEKWLAKIPEGQYVCQRGWHKLKSGWQGWTYLVTGVPHHSGILFHPGNKEDDSEGCILLGYQIVRMTHDTRWITQSKRAFGAFLRAQNGADQFNLTVVDATL